VVSTEIMTKDPVSYGVYTVRAKMFPESHENSATAIGFIDIDAQGNDAAMFNGFDGKKSDDMSSWTITLLVIL